MLRVACFDACGCGVCARIMLSCPDARVSEKGWAGCVEEIPADISRPATDCRPRAAMRDGHGSRSRVHWPCFDARGRCKFSARPPGSSLNRSRFGGSPRERKSGSAPRARAPARSRGRVSR